MKLTELDPDFIKINDFIHDQNFKIVKDVKEADGIMFYCPVCLANQQKGADIHVHSIICWQPKVPSNIHPNPGRWNLVGTSFEDLSLINGSSSVYLQGGCKAHFFITNGEIKIC